MKAFYYLLATLFLVSCSSTRVVDSWTNKEYSNYKPKKVLIVGITDNLTARTIFEEQLKNELALRGIEAIESSNVFAATFTSSKQTEDDINREIEKISKDGIDAVLISAVKGVDEKESYSGDVYRTGYYWRRFGRYYYLYQDVYFDKGYYNNYKVYHIEASLYNLKENNDKSLVWVASYDIVDPKNINATVDDYVKAIIKSLENEQLIPKK
jgi:hypothetical protein